MVATPIGNLQDITLRARDILLATRVIACEDTRRTGQLLKLLAKDAPISKQYLSIRDWNERDQVDKLMAVLIAEDVALVSDAGTPLISDPGFKIVRRALELGVKVVPIPGVSAVTTALSAAGLPSNRFLFWGFWDKKYSLLPEATNIFFESPVRLVKTLETLRTTYPDADIVVANELTKFHERFILYNDDPSDIAQLKGEVTILVYIPKQIATSHSDGDRNLE